MKNSYRFLAARQRQRQACLHVTKGVTDHLVRNDIAFDSQRLLHAPDKPVSLIHVSGLGCAYAKPELA
jgi:hypothetical protein